ncbi:hypothetical protein [Rubellimicrobium roseum]|uniref:PepSY domain-containing protein n=1 Tax=Rubellimicrobium roseum TaxID=687525 RepID=A0A5C4N828_9RHOB|nr:hypothetical protein [Rubellimicrobium roseum]TNC69837.1 hypothetical protein FHG71_13545 [Rubellimicrobium roseum]
MTRMFLATTAVMALSTGAALAQSAAEEVIAGLQAQGYTRIEVKEGPTQMKVEAIQGDTKLEYVYDRATGQVLSREVERVDGDDDTAPGVEIDREDEDFVRSGSRGDGRDDRNGRDDDGDGLVDEADEDDNPDRDHDVDDRNGVDDDGDGRVDEDDEDDNGGDRDRDDDEDDDRGHGNDDDRDDDDNPGRGGDDDDDDRGGRDDDDDDDDRSDRDDDDEDDNRGRGRGRGRGGDDDSDD